MKFIVTILLFFSSLTFSNDATYGSVEVAKILRVYDGDTFFANLKDMPDIIGKNIGIRVRGIDTPEIRGKCDEEKKRAKSAQLFVAKYLVEAHNIVLKDIERGKYFRIVATVIVDGVNLSELLIQKGYAIPYNGRKKIKWCIYSNNEKRKANVK